MKRAERQISYYNPIPSAANRRRPHKLGQRKLCLVQNRTQHCTLALGSYANGAVTVRPKMAAMEKNCARMARSELTKKRQESIELGTRSSLPWTKNFVSDEKGEDAGQSQ